MRVGADQRVGIGQDSCSGWPRAGHDHPGEILQVHLVHDAGIRRYDLEVLKGILSPSQERVPLAIALELELGVDRKGRGRSGLVHLHRVVDHQFDGLKRVDFLGIAPHLPHRIAHRGQVDHRGNARKVLEQNPAGAEGDLTLRVGLGVPAGQATNVVGCDARAVLVAEQVLQQHFQREWQPSHVELVLAEGVKPVVMVSLSSDGQGRKRVKRLGHGSSLRACCEARGPIQARFAPGSMRERGRLRRHSFTRMIFRRGFFRDHPTNCMSKGPGTKPASAPRPKSSRTASLPRGP